VSIIDTHCHLDQPQFDEDLAAVLERAMAVGVTKIIDPGVDLASCRKALDLADRHSEVFVAIGVHPNDCADFDGGTLAELQEMASHPKVAAIGEIGLDYYRERVPHEQQRKALREQLDLASELDLPVILHCRDAPGSDRDAYRDLLWELAQWGPEVRKRRGPDAILGVLHAFSGDVATAGQAYDLGLVLSLGGPVTFANARGLRQVVPELQVDRLMFETDAPYLAPEPYRGRRNEPAYLPLVVEALATLCKISPSAVEQRTCETAHRCFGRLSQKCPR
jgi:TatD DNase family protein